MRRVLVIMSTYNGEKYLHDQLDSVYNQKDVDITLLVRDDGSKDATIPILNEYKEKYGKMEIVIGPNIGAARSFHAAYYYAATKMPTFDYYAFCDQDDVWFENKLSTSIKHIDAESKQPQLFYAPAVLVDSHLTPIQVEGSKIVNCLGANIASSHSLGCTQVFNRALLQKIIKIQDYISKEENAKKYIPLHDGWTALVAYSLGKVEVGASSLMYYRQHQKNVVGGADRGLKRFKRRIQRYFQGNSIKSEKCRILLNVMGEEIPNESKILLEKCANYTDSLYKRIRLAFCFDLYHYGLLDNLGIFIVILLKKF